MSSGELSALERYRRIFCPRLDDYAYWSGRSWLRAHAPLTNQVLAAGLAGLLSVSGYMTAADGRTSVLALDFDTDDRDLDKAQVTARWMDGVGVGAFVEPSRNDRAHLWLPLDAPVPASAGRRFLALALRNAALESGGAHIERFPKQDGAPAAGDVGSCLRLPMMPNPKNGIRYPLCDPRTLNPLGETLDQVIAAVVQAPSSTVEDLAGPEPEPTERLARSVPERIREFNETNTVSKVLDELWQVRDPEPGRSVRCPAHDDVHPSLSIFKDDRRVLCYSPDCVLNNGGRGRDAYDLFGLAPTPEEGLR